MTKSDFFTQVYIRVLPEVTHAYFNEQSPARHNVEDFENNIKEANRISSIARDIAHSAADGYEFFYRKMVMEENGLIDPEDTEDAED